MWTIPDELLVENGGNIIKTVNEDGSISYKPKDVKYGVGSYTGAGMPDMSRNKEFASKQREDKGFLLTYDENGYCIEAQNLDWITPADSDTNNGHFKK